MSVSASRITADGLRAYIERVELPCRLSLMPPDFVKVILRCGGFVGSAIEHHHSLDRTMLYARKHIEKLENRDESVASGTTFIADHLTGSKGRFARRWHAPSGGLWGSLIYVNTLLPHSRLLLPIAVGIACCEALRESGAENAALRWINDVLINDRKVAGFLLESFWGGISNEEYTLLGFGVNLNNYDFPVDLATIATSLGQHSGRAVDLESFTYCFLAKLTWNLGLLCHEEEQFLKSEIWSGSRGRHPLIERWCELSDSLGRRVVFGFDVLTRPQYEAMVINISDNGGLILKLDDGSQITEHSGEIRYL